MDWSLLGCGARGHITFAPDEPALRERLSVRTREGTAWRCLRCGTFVVGEPVASGPAPAAPRVRRGTELRSAFILRLFAIERFLRALIFAGLAVAIWQFKSSRLTIEQAYEHALPGVRTLLRELGINVNHSRLLGLINHAFTLDPRILTWLALGCAAYAVIEIIEGTGLWLLKRWGEYFAMVATSVGLPYEVYDLTAKVTALRLVAFAINLALVIYLVVAKRLFGVRGGKKAYEAKLRSASILQAEIDAVAAAPGPGTAAAGPAGDAPPPAEPAAGTAPAHPGAQDPPAAEKSPPAGKPPPAVAPTPAEAPTPTPAHPGTPQPRPRA
jgi:uncharacterized membrane protein (DUF2068 family)